MPSKFWEFEPRRPRHHASPQATAVFIRRLAPAGSPWVEAVLGDVSRLGLRLLHTPPMSVGERVELQIPLSDRPASSLQASVRWSLADGERCELACQLDRPLDWEVMGELVLRGAVAGEDAGEETPRPWQDRR